MTVQGSVIREIDLKSSLQSSDSAEISTFKIAVYFRLVFLPCVAFVRSVFWVGELSSSSGQGFLLRAINGFVLEFVRQAKKYEKSMATTQTCP